MDIVQIEGIDAKLGGRLEAVRPVVKKLWYRGELRSEMLKKTVAIVGSRRMSRYGRAIVEEIVPRLCGAGYTVVSGLMYGVDQLAHKKTLEGGGTAVAVLGWGIERVNDPESDRLADEIVTHGGVVMSEYPVDTRGQLWTFPQRNRIVVGLSDIIIVVEAGVKSGTMSTVKWAEKMQKPVYAVPGSMFAKTSEGANYMIETGLARPLTKTVVEMLCGGEREVSSGGDRGNGELNESEKVILGYLQVVGASSVNEIVRGSKLAAGEILSTLSALEMRGIVVEERGVFAIV